MTLKDRVTALEAKVLEIEKHFRVHDPRSIQERATGVNPNKPVPAAVVRRVYTEAELRQIQFTGVYPK